MESSPAAVETAAVAASGVSKKSEYKLEGRSSTNAVAIRRVVKVECGPPKKRQVVEIISRDGLSRDAVTSIATQARDRLWLVNQQHMWSNEPKNNPSNYFTHLALKKHSQNRASSNLFVLGGT